MGKSIPGKCQAHTAIQSALVWMISFSLKISCFMWTLHDSLVLNQWEQLPWIVDSIHDECKLKEVKTKEYSSVANYKGKCLKILCYSKGTLFK